MEPFSTWISYALDVHICGETTRKLRTPSCGAVMKAKVKTAQPDSANPYGPLACIFLLLAVGIMVKLAAATQIIPHLFD
jgi:hypothetical protein